MVMADWATALPEAPCEGAPGHPVAARPAGGMPLRSLKEPAASNIPFARGSDDHHAFITIGLSSTTDSLFRSEASMLASIAVAKNA